MTELDGMVKGKEDDKRGTYERVIISPAAIESVGETRQSVGATGLSDVRGVKAPSTAEANAGRRENEGFILAKIG